MIRRHFITGVDYKPNVVITYHSEKAIIINKNKYDTYFASLGHHPTPNFVMNIIVLSHIFENGIGVIELLIKNNNSIGIGFTSQSYENNEDIFITDSVITKFKITNIMGIGDIPPMVNKLILPETLIFNDNIFKNTLLTKLIFPPYCFYNDSYFTNQIIYVNENSNLKELIFTGYDFRKYDAYKNSNIVKCPPNLVDKYKEYYTNVTAANNIIYMKLHNINYDVDKIDYSFDYLIYNSPNEGLYIVRNKINNNTEELSIIFYDDITTLNVLDCIRKTTYIENGSHSYIGSSFSIADIILPKTITILNLDIFDDNLTKLIIPEHITKITGKLKGYILSENVINLSSVTLSTSHIIENGKDENGCVINSNNELIYIRNGLYEDIIIPDYVTTIKSNINKSIKNLLYIPSSVNYIDVGYYNVIYTNNLIIDKDNKIYDSRDNCNAIIKTDENKMIYRSNNTFIPDSVMILGENLNFDKNIDLNNVTMLKNGVFNAFSYSELNKNDAIYITKYITFLDPKFIAYDYDNICDVKLVVDKKNPIYDDRNGSDVVVETATNSLIKSNSNIIPESVEIIKSYAFSYNINIKGERILYIPSTIKLIERYSFQSLQVSKIVYNGTIEQWNNITIHTPIFYYTNPNVVYCIDGEIELTT